MLALPRIASLVCLFAAQGHRKEEEEEEGKAPGRREMRRARSLRGGGGTRSEAGRDVPAGGAGSSGQPRLRVHRAPAHLAGVTPVPNRAVSIRSCQHEEGRTDRHREPGAHPERERGPREVTARGSPFSAHLGALQITIGTRIQDTHTQRTPSQIGSKYVFPSCEITRR